MENKHFCQSCSMPIDSIDLAGTETDGSPNWEYCVYCYKNGAFTKPDMTLQGMAEFIQAEMKRQNIQQEITQMSLDSLAHLKRWRTEKTEK
jgi:hypothetical protein